MRVLNRALLAMCLGLPGCILQPLGLVFTDVVEPLDLNLHETPVGEEAGRSEWKTFNYIVRVDWDTSAIVDAAHTSGITRIYFCDLETLSILGVWRTQTAIVYGTGPKKPTADVAAPASDGTKAQGGG
jgi:hypothetical protein